MPDDTNYTTGVSVLFTLNSTHPSAPFNMTNCSGSISYSQATASDFQGWVAEDLGTPDPNGATFTLKVQDLDYLLQNSQTGVAFWAVTFIPRTGTTWNSPFSNNQNTISGNGGTNDGTGVFTLNTSTVAIKNTGTWDWSLMIQMTLPSVVKCFASDPEMEVGA